MRIAIFGDSHAGRIKRTWDRTVRHDDNWTTEWFVQRSQGVHPLQFSSVSDDTHTCLDDVLLLDDKTFRADDYDAVLVVGMGPCMQWAMELLQQFAHPRIGSPQGRALAGPSWESALLDSFASSTAGDVMRAIRGTAPTLPLVYVPAVRPMAWINDRPGHTRAWSLAIHTSGSAPAVQEMYLHTLEDFTSLFAATYVDQPSDTVVDCCWTHPAFGFATYGDESNSYWNKGDYFHSNDIYATAVINTLGTVDVLTGLPEAYVWPDAASGSVRS
ncbi:hypothetical protein [Kocuria sp.]|uniref:hypothetical protein n=1 Tax=Kocuria sp. TaxID=1871328 RepID=UPI0028A00376|nr:hypothetical protein [Kocuria sp.]